MTEAGHQRPDLAWRKMDLHIHTPGSSDYQEDGVTFIQILQRAEERGLDIIAFTDHNSVNGYARMWREIEDLELLEALGRIAPEEAALLAEYRRLLNRILLLPGFEFTATFGFHILALYPPETSIRKLEHALLSLNIPEDKLDLGTSEVGATTDVIHAYERLAETGAIIIGAHVNSTHGIAMQGFPFGGQTKIAYTQHPALHALEATDLDSTSPRSTIRFFNGSKPEYPRRMHCIQGSDAHRLVRHPEREKDLGVGDRVTEVLLPEVSFAALKALFESDDFSHVRPYSDSGGQLQAIIQARAEGNTASQVFHERLGKSRRRSNAIFKDIVAFANDDGGTAYIGLDATAGGEIVGVPRSKLAADQLREDIERFITPVPPVSIEIQPVMDRDVLVVVVASGPDKPYALTSGEIYVRDGADTVIASRDRIVDLVRRSITVEAAPGVIEPGDDDSQLGEGEEEDGTDLAAGVTTEDGVPLPRTGVEIVSSEIRDGVIYHTMRDLRNLKVVENVTRDSARRLWRYAIRQREAGPVDPEQIRWFGPFGLVRRQRQRDGSMRYDLAYREDGEVRVFYGVTPRGLPDAWQPVVAQIEGWSEAGERVDQPTHAAD